MGGHGGAGGECQDFLVGGRKEWTKQFWGEEL